MSKPSMGKWSEVARSAPPSTGSELKVKTSGFSDHLLGSVEKLQPRLAFTFQVLIGCTVQVKVKDGKIYRGIFSAVEIESPGSLSIVLKMATSLQESQGQATDWKKIAEAPVASMIIAGGDLVSLVAHGVSMDASSVGPAPEDMGFGTDSAISKDKGGAGLIGRQLEKWVPESDDPLTLLEDETFGSSNAGGWDQFAANSAMYGVQTTFDEGFYTTQLDKSNAGITEQDAERIAREIEKGSKGVNNRHMLEERGIAVDDSGEMDEEDRYSSVIRPESSKPSEPAPSPKLESTNESGTKKPKPGGTPAPKTEDTSDKAAPAPASSSKLNANAKPFALNPKAKEFVPGASTTKAAVPSSHSSSNKNARSPNYNWNAGPGYQHPQHMMVPGGWASSGHVPPVHGGSWIPPAYQHPGMMSGTLPPGAGMVPGMVPGGAMGRSPGYSGPQAMPSGNYGHPQSVPYVPPGQYMMMPEGFNPSQQNSMQGGT